jgi:hypothetical protein
MSKITRTIKMLIVFTLSILPLISATSLQAATLAPFSSRVGAFSVMMPGQPQYKTETIKTAAGPVILHKYIAEAERGQHAYLVAYSDFRVNMNAAEVFNSTRQDVVKILNGRIISERPTSIDGYPGRVFMAENADHLVVIKAYLVGKRFYKVIFVKAKASAYPSEAERFFSSFRVGAARNQLAVR